MAAIDCAVRIGCGAVLGKPVDLPLEEDGYASVLFGIFPNFAERAAAVTRTLHEPPPNGVEDGAQRAKPPVITEGVRGSDRKWVVLA